MPKNQRMHQEWASVVGVGKGEGLRTYLGGAKGLVCQLPSVRLAQGFQHLSSHIVSVYPEGLGRS